MSERKHVRVYLGPGGPMHSWVEINGERQTNVRSIEICGATDKATTVKLELINVDVELDALVETTHLGSTSREYEPIKLKCESSS